MRILVEVRCGEKSGRCGQLLGNIIKYDDGKIVFAHDPGPTSLHARMRQERNKPGFFSLPLCTTHKYVVLGDRWNNMVSGFVNLDVEIDEAERTKTKVLRLITRADFAAYFPDEMFD